MVKIAIIIVAMALTSCSSDGYQPMGENVYKAIPKSRPQS